jgi:ribonuclease I
MATPNRGPAVARLWPQSAAAKKIIAQRQAACRKKFPDMPLTRVFILEKILPASWLLKFSRPDLS